LPLSILLPQALHGRIGETGDDERGLPHLPFAVFGSASKKKKICFENLKKSLISLVVIY
jgi:hypothetical protein